MQRVLFMVVMLALAAPASAQPARGAWRPAGEQPFRTRMSPALNAAERALYERERLELSEEQIERLDALRRNELERLAARDREMRELSSRIRAGVIDEDDDEVERFRDREDAEDDADEAAYEEVESILTEDQRDELSELRGVWSRAPRAGVMPRRPLRAPRPPRADDGTRWREWRWGPTPPRLGWRAPRARVEMWRRWPAVPPRAPRWMYQHR